jgi:hypothetical protein
VPFWSEVTNFPLRRCGLFINCRVGPWLALRLEMQVLIGHTPENLPGFAVASDERIKLKKLMRLLCGFGSSFDLTT